jgi:hypothetical protein
MKSLLTIPCLIALTICPGSPALAQNEAGNCGVVAREIVTLRMPRFEDAPQWKQTLGAPGPDIPSAAIPLADGGIVLAGSSALYERDKGLEKTKLFLARLGRDGKKVWEKRQDILGFMKSGPAIALKDRLVILSQVEIDKKAKAGRIDFLDGLGDPKSFKLLRDPKYDLYPVALVPGKGGKSIVAAFRAVDPKRPDDEFTVIKTLSPDGTEIRTRQYLPGIANRLESLKKTPQGDLVGAGRIRSNGVASGWLIVLDGDDGDIQYQRAYARGREAMLRAAAMDDGGNIIASGEAMPGGGEGARAGWILKIAPGGNPLWQRYIGGGFAFSGRDIALTETGQAMALLNARPTGKDGRDHVRIVSFAENGRMIGDDAYLEGPGVQGVSLIDRAGGRYLTGVVQSGLSAFVNVENQKLAGYDYWLLDLAPFRPSPDPCATPRADDGFADEF